MNKILLTFLMLVPVPVFTQNFELVLGAGLSTYYGDLTTVDFNKLVSDARPVLHLEANTGTENSYFFKATYHYTKFDVSNDLTGLHFQSHLHEFSLHAGLNLLQLLIKRPTRFYPYASLGVGFFHFNPESTQGGETYALQTLGTEGQGIPGYPESYKLWQPVVPLTGGIKFWLTDQVSIGGELSYQHLFTDYLDDVSNTEVDYRTLMENNGLVAARFSNPGIDPENPVEQTYRRGNQYPDVYYFAKIVFGVRFAGPRIFRPGSGYRRIKNSRVRCPILQ